MSSTLRTLQLTICILLYINIKLVLAKEERAYTVNGIISGKTITTRNGRNLKAFRGIPYAKPPIGRLRFKNPEPAESWDDTFVADTDGNQCPQIDDNGLVVGDEDCLYLNVYSSNVWSPDITKEDAEAWAFFPVMVYIHGGDFVRGNGSSTMYGPEYLLDKDVILVTLNYRLGVLGFLATGDQHATGNFGLKDQVLALKWVQENIMYLGGDQSQITLFGQGAGGASVHLHSLSDASDGLFHQFISQSGNALCFWAFTEINEYKKYARDLGEYLNCSTRNSEVLIECLRQMDIHSLVDTNKIFNDTFYIFNTWGPTEEPHHSGSFMPFNPINKWMYADLKSYPSIIGYTRHEGLILTAQFYSNNGVYEKIKNNFDAFLQYVTTLYMGGENTIPVDDVKKFYFNDTEPSDKETFTMQMTNFITDTVFLRGAVLEFRGPAKAMTYCYSFEYRGTISQTSRVIGSNDNIGVAHGDDLIYLFPMNAEQFGQQQLEYSESDEQMIDTMIDLWTSFARDGIPSSKRFPEPFFWPPYISELSLEIGNNSDTSLSRHDNSTMGRIVFWKIEVGIVLYSKFMAAMEGGR